MYLPFAVLLQVRKPTEGWETDCPWGPEPDEKLGAPSALRPQPEQSPGPSRSGLLTSNPTSARRSSRHSRVCSRKMVSSDPPPLPMRLMRQPHFLRLSCAASDFHGIVDGPHANGGNGRRLREHAQDGRLSAGEPGNGRRPSSSGRFAVSAVVLTRGRLGNLSRRTTDHPLERRAESAFPLSATVGATTAMGIRPRREGRRRPSPANGPGRPALVTF